MVIVLGSVGTFLLLPHRHGTIKPGRVHAVGAAVAGLILTVTSRNPVYSALWFASVVLSTSGLFLLSGAQFLAAGTVIVYAGAIIVTFLFVIMLAQSEGQALYDRMARAPGRATVGSFVLLAAVLSALLHARTPESLYGGGVTSGPAHPVPAEALAAKYRSGKRTGVGAVL